MINKNALWLAATLCTTSSIISGPVSAAASVQDSLSASLLSSKLNSGDNNEIGVDARYTRQLSESIGLSLGGALYEMGSNDTSDYMTFGVYSSFNYTLPISYFVRPTFRIGMQHWRSDYDYKDEVSAIDKEDGNNFFVSVGTEFQVARDINLSLNYRRSTFGYSEGDETLNTLMVGVSTNFSWLKQPQHPVMTPFAKNRVSKKRVVDLGRPVQPRVEKVYQPEVIQPEPVVKTYEEPKPKKQTRVEKVVEKKKVKTRRTEAANEPGGSERKSVACDDRFAELFSSCR